MVVAPQRSTRPAPAGRRAALALPARTAWLVTLAALALAVVPATPAAVLVAQPAATHDTNILHPVAYIKQRLLAPDLDILEVDRSRPLETDRARRVVLGGADGAPPMQVHLKPVAAPGEGFNNQPRYELAAYRFQKMFLDEPGYVVPPTVLRAMPIEDFRRWVPARAPTIRGTESVLFLLAYWVQNLVVDTVEPFHPDEFERNESYRRHFANANILTHLIDHKDGNHGNMLISMDGANRRVFAVDNDVAFRSQISDRGDRWRRIIVDQLPAATIERLRSITRAQLDAELGVVAEFAIVNGQLEPVEHGDNLQPGRGVRLRDGRVQFGLTRAEIGDLENRIQRLIRDADRGRFTLF